MISEAMPGSQILVFAFNTTLPKDPTFWLHALNDPNGRHGKLKAKHDPGWCPKWCCFRRSIKKLCGAAEEKNGKPRLRTEEGKLVFESISIKQLL